LKKNGNRAEWIRKKKEIEKLWKETKEVWTG